MCSVTSARRTALHFGRLHRASLGGTQERLANLFGRLSVEENGEIAVGTEREGEIDPPLLYPPNDRHGLGAITLVGESDRLHPPSMTGRPHRTACGARATPACNPMWVAVEPTGLPGLQPPDERTAASRASRLREVPGPVQNPRR